MTRQQRRAEQRKRAKAGIQSVGLLQFGVLYKADSNKGIQMVFGIEEGQLSPFELSQWTKDTAENMKESMDKFSNKDLIAILENQVKSFKSMFFKEYDNDNQEFKAKVNGTFYKNAIALSGLVYYMEKIRKILKPDNFNGLFYGHNLK